MLTDSKIRNVRAAEKSFKMYDADGLFLFVTPAGSKIWRLKYKENSKEKLATFGKYPALTLNEARKKKDDFKLLLARGELPQKNEKKDENFGEITQEWFQKKEKNWAFSHSQKIKLSLAKNVLPFLSQKNITLIEPVEILDLLRKIEARGAVDLAHRTRGILSQIFRYGIATGRAKYNPAGELVGALSPVRVKHYAAPTNPAAVAELLRAVEAFTGSLHVRVALQLAPMLFVRPGELRKMEWIELNFEEAEWRIPAEKMKMREAHIVPLSRQAINLIKELPEIGKYCFPNAGRDKQKAMSEAAINAALRRLGFNTKTEITAHGFRATARTLLHEVLNYDPAVIEHQLAHRVPDALGTAYNRTKFLDKRREMMQAWADYLDELRAGSGKVLKFG